MSILANNKSANVITSGWISVNIYKFIIMFNFEQLAMALINSSIIAGTGRFPNNWFVIVSANEIRKEIIEYIIY